MAVRLMVGLIQVIETCKAALDRMPEAAKAIAKNAIRLSSMQKKRSCVTDAVIDIVVDKVWTAFKAAMVVKIRMMSIVTGDDVLRSLRVLVS
jgi:hypothetical protein